MLLVRDRSGQNRRWTTAYQSPNKDRVVREQLFYLHNTNLQTYLVELPR